MISEAHLENKIDKIRDSYKTVDLRVHVTREGRAAKSDSWQGHSTKTFSQESSMDFRFVSPFDLLKEYSCKLMLGSLILLIF